MESIKYYNSNIVPYMKPAHLPYRRQNIETTYWGIIPTILRYLWIVNVGAMQASRSDTDPLSNANLVQYRGRSLNELQHLMKDVPEAVNDPFGVALYSILFMMGADLQISGPQWSSHLEAARKVIGLKSGLGTCFEDFPASYTRSFDEFHYGRHHHSNDLSGPTAWPGIRSDPARMRGRTA